MSDAAFELIGACVHSIRFTFTAQIDYPYASARLADDNPPESLFRRVQVASPPPSRNGRPWQTGLILDRKPFDPAGPLDRLSDVEVPTGLDGLGTPDPDAIILDLWLDVPKAPAKVDFPGSDVGRYILSVPYWQPVRGPGETVSMDVAYSATLRVLWTKAPTSRWVAVSFDAFWPVERDSADVLIPLGACDSLCPR
ncbi:hypothetical protein [Actinoplanes regularis]|uniref:hypothetical protein n=1 Tax=Actinoplanes regularis TaxID=52697 RepID=UPI00255582D9|nr:hypothetical protein [Actinoplanes regularis]